MTVDLDVEMIRSLLVRKVNNELRYWLRRLMRER